MPPRKMTTGQKLWKRGDPAPSIVIIEKGYLTIHDDDRVVGIAPPGTVLGESALFSLWGAPVTRTADIVAMTPAKVTEFPVHVVQEGFTAGTPKIVLRSLFGQIGRNALLVIAAHPKNETVQGILRGMLRAIAETEPRFAEIADWPTFVATFQTLYHLREASDDLRRALTKVPTAARELERAAQAMKETFSAPESIEYLQPFLEAERQRKLARP